VVVGGGFTGLRGLEGYEFGGLRFEVRAEVPVEMVLAGRYDDSEVWIFLSAWKRISR
jgi:hypothetical protein